jgi:nucleoside-diphosphate-sugar epimerase
MQYAEITDRMALLRAAEGCDSIAHLARIPNPGRMDDVLFNINVVGTQYLLDAAMAHGIKRVALASSCCALALSFPRIKSTRSIFRSMKTTPTCRRICMACPKC